MTQASKKKKSQAPTRSFDQMVADAQIKRLEPLVQQHVAQTFQGVTQAIYKFIMTERSQIQTRLLAFERILKANVPWFNEDVLEAEIAAVEDEAQGYVAVDTPTEVGDKVRVNVYVKEGGAESYALANKVAIHQVAVKGPGEGYQTNESLELAVVGLKAGESREFQMVYGDLAPELNTAARVDVVRVSRLAPTEAKQ